MLVLGLLFLLRFFCVSKTFGSKESRPGSCGKKIIAGAFVTSWIKKQVILVEMFQVLLVSACFVDTLVSSQEKPLGSRGTCYALKGLSLCADVQVCGQMHRSFGWTGL